MNIENLTNLGLSEEASATLLSDIETALNNEYERGLNEGKALLDEFKLNQALSEALLKANSKNPEILKSLIDLSVISMENGEVTGLSEQLDAIRKDNPFLFEDDFTPKFSRKIKSSGQITKKDFDTMSYSDRIKLFSKNPALYNSLKG